MTEREVSSERVSALPPVDGLEVVAWAYPLGEKMDVTTDRELACDSFPGVAHPVSLVTLSQASSVIAGLRSERITAERDALDAYGKLQAAEVRISSLEDENKRLREALKQQIPGHRDPEGNCWCRYGHNPDYGHTLSCVAARQALGDHNG